MSQTRSEALFAEALNYIPGGVNSPVRAFRAVGGQPFFVNRASGSRVWDVDGHDYIDYVLTWGPAILGHGHPKIIAAVKAAAIAPDAQTYAMVVGISKYQKLPKELWLQYPDADAKAFGQHLASARGGAVATHRAPRSSRPAGGCSPER